MKIHETAFVHPTAVLHGDIEVGEGTSIWAHAAIRGDFNTIRIGSFSSVQDTCVLHCAPMNPLSIGNYVTVGHGAVIHGAKIGDYVLVGMGAIVLDGAQVGDGSLIAAGSVVAEGTVVPPDSFVRGNPATVKPAREGTRSMIRSGAVSYHLLSRRYIEGKDFITVSELIARMKEWEEKAGRE